MSNELVVDDSSTKTSLLAPILTRDAENDGLPTNTNAILQRQHVGMYDTNFPYTLLAAIPHIFYRVWKCYLFVANVVSNKKNVPPIPPTFSSASFAHGCWRSWGGVVQQYSWPYYWIGIPAWDTSLVYDPVRSVAPTSFFACCFLLLFSGFRRSSFHTLHFFCDHGYRDLGYIHPSHTVLSPSIDHLLTHSLTRTHTHSFTRPLTDSLADWRIDSFVHSLTDSLYPLLTKWPNRYLTNLVTNWLTDWLTHWLLD